MFWRGRRAWRSWEVLAVVAGVGWVAAVCIGVALAQQAPRPDWRGTGVVVALLPPPSDLHPTRPVVIIQHDAIPGLMDEKMSMPFIAASTALFQGLRPGDRIAFGLRETSGALLVVSLDRLPRPK